MEYKREFKSEMQSHLPANFDFFHLGKVESADKKSRPEKDLKTEPPFSILFKITGEEHSYCLISFDDRPASSSTESMRVEIANILVSKFLSSLIDETGAHLELSAPEILSPSESSHRHLLKMVQASAEKTITQHYEYVSAAQGASRIPFKLYYLPSMKGTS